MKSTTANVLGDAATALGALINHGASLGLGFLGSLYGTRSGIPTPGTGCRCGGQGCSCCVPPPCWVPQSLCDLTSTACPGGEAMVRFRVTNCGAAPRHIKAEAGPSGPTLTPGELTLGPMERGFIVASFTVATDAAKGEEREFILWIRGCQDHFLRWTVKVAASAACACAEVDVEDCPDLIHHWYDHFYCHRPCVKGH
jgi:hypothetical protein